jgi:hypothetical protein
LKDDKRAVLRETSNAKVGQKRKFDTSVGGSERDLMEFIFLSSPDGIFASIMSFL